MFVCAFLQCLIVCKMNHGYTYNSYPKKYCWISSEGCTSLRRKQIFMTSCEKLFYKYDTNQLFLTHTYTYIVYLNIISRPLECMPLVVDVLFVAFRSTVTQCISKSLFVLTLYTNLFCHKHSTCSWDKTVVFMLYNHTSSYLYVVFCNTTLVVIVFNMY